MLKKNKKRRGGGGGEQDASRSFPHAQTMGRKGWQEGERAGRREEEEREGGRDGRPSLIPPLLPNIKRKILPPCTQLVARLRRGGGAAGCVAAKCTPSRRRGRGNSDMTRTYIHERHDAQVLNSTPSKSTSRMNATTPRF